MATLRGTFRALLPVHQDPIAFMNALHENLRSDPLEYRFTASLLLLYPATKTLLYLSYNGKPLIIFNPASCSYAELSADTSIYLGDYHSRQPVEPKVLHWSEKEILFLNNLDKNFSGNYPADLPALKELLITSNQSSFTTQQQAENLLRKMSLSLLSGVSDRPLSVLAYKM